jgi:class 3 adenylate cyclase
MAPPDPETILRPYVPALASRWLGESPDEQVQIRSGTLAYIDISGFTRLTELLAARGKAGAEEMTGYLDAIFGELIGTAYAHQGELIKWGGDAIFVWYSDADHAGRAVNAAWRMQKSMARIGRLQTSAGRSTLRMSVGIHSGDFHFFSVGKSHRELLVAGPAATVTAHLEAVAEAGEIVVSASTARQLPSRVLGAAKADGILLTADPRVTVTQKEVAEAVRGQPSLSLPSALSTHLVAAPVESEHRQVAVAFIEFSAVDDLLEQVGAATVAGMLDELVTGIQDACVRHAVTFWETDIGEGGGKVMLVAGAPSSTDDDAGRLLSTVREVLDGGGPLRLRAGINSGRVFAGGFGPLYRRTYSAKGDAVNLAARVMGRARPGEIYVSDAALRRSRVRFGSEELEPFLVKGKAAPVHAHRLGAPREGGSSFGLADQALFGRETEVRVLEDQLAAAVGGRGSCVVLAGAPGLGKSRLIAEVDRAAGDMVTLMVDCDQYGSLVPYSSLRALFRQAIGLDPEASARSAANALRAAVERRRCRPHPRDPCTGRAVPPRSLGTSSS